MRHIAIALAFAAGCGAGAPVESTNQPEIVADNAGSLIFPRQSRPFGRDMITWQENMWAWTYSAPTAHNPFLDTTGADCGINQAGPVWYLPSAPDPGGTAVVTRACTIPRHKAIAVMVDGVLNDFPCPDPTFKPAPGQSLYDFLAAGAKQVVDLVSRADVQLDGRPVIDALADRVTSDDLFTFTGDASLAQSVDGCITGSPQPGVADGHMVIFRPLAPGAHTLVIHDTDTKGTDFTLRYNLTITDECQ